MVMLFDVYNLPDNIYEIVFATKQQAIVAKLLIRELKLHNNELDKTMMSLFATRLHEGDIYVEIDETPFTKKKIKISYNKRQFYDRILTPMRTMGLIDYDMYKKTYSISKRYIKILQEIGKMWDLESR